MAGRKRSVTIDFLADTKGAQKGMKIVSGEAKTTGDKFSAMGSTIKYAMGSVAAVAVAKAVGDMVGKASDLNESINAVEVVFGESAGAIADFRKTAASELGMSERAVNEAAVVFSSFLEKVNPENVPGTFEDLITRAADFASVMNLDVDEAIQTFRSGLSGESEPLRKFGIDLSAASVGAYAVANGIAESASKMTEAEKVQARYGLLMEQTDKTAGDFANTSGSLANQQRILAAEWENAQAKLGEALLPLATQIMPKIVDLAQDITTHFIKLRKEGNNLAAMFDFLPGIADNKYAKDLNAMFDAMLSFAAATEDGVPRVKALGESLVEMYDAGYLNNLTLGELQKELGLTDKEMVGASRSVYEYAEAQGATEAEIRQLVTMFGPYLSVLQDEAREHKSASTAAMDQLYALEGLEQQTDDSTDATDDLTKSTMELANEKRKAADPVYALRDAHKKYQEAIEKVAQLEADGKVGTEEYMDAQLDLTEAIGDLDYAQTVMAENPAAIDALETLLERAGLSKDEIRNLIGEIETYNTTAVAPKDFLMRIVGDYGEPGKVSPGGIPMFDSGGVVPGPRGKPRLVVAHGGETILPTHKAAGQARYGTGSAPRTQTIIVEIDGKTLAHALMDPMAEQIRVRTGTRR